MGWSVESLALAAQELGFPAISHGLVQNVFHIQQTKQNQFKPKRSRILIENVIRVPSNSFITLSTNVTRK
jgi:hypothetical protein